MSKCEEIRAEIDSLANEIKILCEALPTLKTFEERRKVMDEMMAKSKRMSELDTLHKKELFNNFRKLNDMIITKFKEKIKKA
jgi:hypothetical protein